MICDSLSSFLLLLEDKKELVHIKEPVSPSLEITEITHRVVKNRGPALLFENVEGSSYPLVINLFGTRERMALALGVSDPEEIGDRIEDLLKIPQKMGKGFVSNLSLLPRLKEFTTYPPKKVKKAPVQEVVLTGQSVNLYKFPILTCWPEDGGPFITLPMVITRDKETKMHNMGMYRMQVFEQNRTGMHWHIHKGGAHHFRSAYERGERLEVAVALGGDPVTIYSSTAPCPGQVDEYLLAGFLRKKPVELVKALSVDLMVPAQAEIILEGYVDPLEEMVEEGPFGDHTGYYSLPDRYPSFHITTITHRKEPIYPATIVGPPPMEDFWMGFATERIFLPLARIFFPEIVDFHMPPEGVFHNLVFVSMKKEYPGHALKVAHGLLGLGLMMLCKVLVIVEEDVEVQNPREAWWVALNNIDPQRDVTFVPGPVDPLDHASSIPLYGSKMIVDATRKGKGEGFQRPWPERISMDQKTVERIDEIWDQLGL